jgi:hypothetical protein
MGKTIMAGHDNFVPVQEVKPPDEDFQPVGEPKNEIGGVEAFGRGAAQAFGLGYSPQLIAAAKTMKLPGSEDPEYLRELAKQKTATEQSWEQHPYLYGSGMIASAIPAAASAIFSAPEAAAAGTIGLGARLLAGGSNVGSIGGAGLRAIAGEGAGILPSAARGVATVAENPLAQGAIFGSSEGETPYEKVAGAISGAGGAYLAPKVLGAVGSGIKAIGSEIAPKVTDPILAILTGSPVKAGSAAQLANEIGISVPRAAAADSRLLSAGSAADVLNQVPKASAKTLGELGGKIAGYSENLETKDVGNSVRTAVLDWVNNPEASTSLKSKLNQLYEPVRALSASSEMVYPNNFRNAISAAENSPLGRMSPNISATLKLTEPAIGTADKAGGLTFEELKTLRGVISDQIGWNKISGQGTYSDEVLNNFRKAITRDMDDLAKQVGGEEMSKTLANVNNEASKLYNIRDSLFKITGNPKEGGTGFKTDDQIYSAIIKAAGKTGGRNITELQNLQQQIGTHAPDVWNSVGKAYAAKIAPDGQFSFNNFNKLYDSYFHPKGKDLLFGASGSNGIRDTLDKINQFGNIGVGKTKLGEKLDSLASGQGVNKKAFAGLGASAAESAILGGLPLRTLATGTAGAAIGARGAQNIAAPATKYIPSATEKTLNEALGRAAPLVGARSINPYGMDTVGNALIPFAVQNITNQLPEQIWSRNSESAKDVRYGRKHGGRVSDRLIREVERAKKSINSDTESLLNTPDSHVAHALEIANRNLEG